MKDLLTKEERAALGALENGTYSLEMRRLVVGAVNRLAPKPMSDEELVERLDRLAYEQQYTNQTEVIREAVTRLSERSKHAAPTFTDAQIERMAKAFFEAVMQENAIPWSEVRKHMQLGWIDRLKSEILSAAGES